MVCEAHGVLAATPDRSSERRGGQRQQVEWRSTGVVWSPEAGCQCSPQRERDAGFVPVAMTGTLVGCVEGPVDPRTPIRVLLRDARRALVREYHPAFSRAGHVSAGFELRGLPSDSYTLEIWAPGFCPERRDGVRIEPSCVTDAGTVHLTRAHLPRIPALLRHLTGCAVFPNPSARRVAWSGWAMGGSS